MLPCKMRRRSQPLSTQHKRLQNGVGLCFDRADARDEGFVEYCQSRRWVIMRVVVEGQGSLEHKRSNDNHRRSTAPSIYMANSGRPESGALQLVCNTRLDSLRQGYSWS
jgi:hypothetical protein